MSAWPRVPRVDVPRLDVPALQAGGLLAGAGVIGALAARAPGVAFATAGAVALGVAILAWPELATLLFIFCLWLNVPALAVDWYGLPQMAGALFPLLLLLPIVHSYRRGNGLVLDGVFALMVALLVVELLSTLGTARPSAAVDRVKQFALEGPIVYFLVVNAVRTPATLRRAVWALLAAGACLSLVSVYQQLTGTYERPYGGFGQVDHAFFRGQSDVARIAGPLGDPNYYAQILLPILALGLLSIWRERRPRARLAAIGATALVGLAITFTYSRGAAVALLGVVVAMTLLHYVRGRHIAALALALALLVALVPAYRDRVATITAIGGATARPGEQTTADVSTRGRATEMLAAGVAFLDHPVLGLGPGAFPDAYQRYAQRIGIEVHEETQSGADKGELPRRESHDIVLGVAADLGLAGLAVFGAIVVVSFRRLLRVRRRLEPQIANLADAILLALVAYLTAGLFLTLAFGRYLWLLVALAGAAAAVRNAESRSSSDSSV
jgi:hypothetical protein